jgi:hypothetical protein
MGQQSTVKMDLLLLDAVMPVMGAASSPGTFSPSGLPSRSSSCLATR